MSLKLSFAPLSDVGRERTENQDAFGSEHQDGLDFYIVCDGMGGHRGGSTASKLGVATLVDYLAEHTDDPPVPRMVRALEVANQTIFEQARTEARFHGMGTTAVVLAIDHGAGTAHYAHVGDSRIYLIRGDTMRQLTRDHTFVQRLVDDGILDRAAAANHPQGNVIIRSLGGQATVDVELGDTRIDLQEGDIFLLCSDGLHGLVEDHEIASIAVSKPLAQAAEEMVGLANDRGGHDNITVELIGIGTRAEAAPDAWTVVQPTPAPGTRLARLAEEISGSADTVPLTSDESPGHDADEHAVPPPDRAPDTNDGEADTGENERTAPMTIEAPTEVRPRPGTGGPEGSKLGAAVAVAVVVAVVTAAIALYSVIRPTGPEPAPSEDASGSADVPADPEAEPGR